MGHRTNYAIRRDGEVELFYSHWGALTVPQDLFWGPDEAESFIRSHKAVDPETEWLDDVWGEGGGALDFDEKVVTLYGGEALGWPPLRDLFRDLMAALWATQGWEVAWADNGMPDIAAAVGFDPSIATAAPVEPFPPKEEDFGQSFRDDEPRYVALITVVDADGPSHRIADSSATSTLYVGPRLLEWLKHLPRATTLFNSFEPPDYAPDWSMGDLLGGFVTVYPADNRIVFAEAYESRGARAFVANKWPGWALEALPEATAAAHFEALGLALPDALVPNAVDLEEDAEMTEEEVLAEIAGELLGERSDPSQMVVRLTQEAEERGEEIWVNPEAAKAPVDAPLDANARQELLGKAIALMKMRRALH